ncbi:MAG: LuxR C-terminal-related transcriptional regulator [Pseudomonadota bacterium]
MTRSWVLWLILAIQAACGIFFVGEIVVTVLGITHQPIDWQVHEAIEIAASFGLVLGVIMGALVLRSAMRRERKARQQLRAASGAFMDLVDDRFSEWRLTAAERDVAFFVIKGFSTDEVARLRNTSPGTVKAQTNAIYRKAGVSSRAQLVSHFVEDLMAERLV